MSRPSWLRSQTAARTQHTTADTWQGRPIPDRQPINVNINYRIHDAHTGELLSFNTTNVLDGLRTDLERTQQEHPGARLVVTQYDGPAYKTGSEP
ncbi:hypothetical protein [Streptacidiphilus sp. EB129]|uniref:hypothetical protein n=1 Tax=Streptacidiphilus sp. EB129 TaxID=3156262 RepID=UPI0035153DB4